MDLQVQVTEGPIQAKRKGWQRRRREDIIPTASLRHLSVQQMATLCFQVSTKVSSLTRALYRQKCNATVTLHFTDVSEDVWPYVLDSERSFEELLTRGIKDPAAPRAAIHLNRQA